MPFNLLHSSIANNLNPNYSNKASGQIVLPQPSSAKPILKAITTKLGNIVQIDTSKPQLIHKSDAKRCCGKCGHFKSMEKVTSAQTYAAEYKYKHIFNGDCPTPVDEYVENDNRRQGWCCCRECQQAAWEINLECPDPLKKHYPAKK